MSTVASAGIWGVTLTRVINGRNDVCVGDVAGSFEWREVGEQRVQSIVYVPSGMERSTSDFG